MCIDVYESPYGDDVHNPLKLVVVSVVNKPSQRCEGSSYRFCILAFLHGDESSCF